VGNAARADATARCANGAIDLTNPATATDKPPAILGMPSRDAGRARTVFFVKRGMASGYAGMDNELFFRPNTMMLSGDAKKVTQEIVQALQRRRSASPADPAHGQAGGAANACALNSPLPPA
jgi:NAD(P) transhydrogenase subunit beta